MPDDQLSTYVHGAPRRIVWYDNGARPANALNVTPVDGSRAPAAYGLGSIRPTAFADAWDGSFVAVRPAEKGALIAYAAAASKRQYLLDMPVLAIAARGGLVLVGGDRVELVDVDLQTQQNVATFRASRVAMTTDFLIASDVDGSGVHRYPYGAGKVDLAADVPLPFYADNGAVAFAVTPDGARAFVAGTTASVIDPVGGKGVVIASVDTPTAIVATGSAEPVTSLAVDRTRAYWTHGASEISYASGASKVVSIATEGRVGQLAIDENCLYYWQERDGSAQLRAITKPQ